MLSSSSESATQMNLIDQMKLIDQNISRRLRQRRLLLGCTQSAVADALGVSFQQIQKYETGANRVNVARLFELSCVLDVPITYFYENLQSVRIEPPPGPKDPDKKGFPNGTPLSKRRVKVEDVMHRAETLTLIHNFYKLKPLVRKSIANMCRGLGS